MIKTADMSPDGVFRHRLTRHWAEAHPLTFIMLNPSTADADTDDPTIRRCMGFARREGFGGIIVVNLSAYRATRPRDVPPLFTVSMVAAIKTAIYDAAGHDCPVVCAWGGGGTAFTDSVHCVRLAAAAYNADLRCLGVTKDGHPRHPLYVKADAPLIAWPAATVVTT